MKDIINEKVVIILNGQPRSGKDTAAQVFEGLGYQHLKFSSALKLEAHRRYGMADRPIDHFEALKDKPLEEFDGKTPRQVYIEVGAQMRAEFGQQVFGEMIAKEIQTSDSKRFIISDLANMDELRPLLHQEGMQTQVIRLHRSGKSFDGDSRTYVTDANLHALDVANDGDVALFHRKMNVIANNVLHIIVNREVRKERDPDYPYFDILAQAKTDIMSSHGIDIDQLRYLAIKGIQSDADSQGYACHAMTKAGNLKPLLLKVDAGDIVQPVSAKGLQDAAKNAISRWQPWEGRPGEKSVSMSLLEMKDYLLSSAIDAAPAIDLNKGSMSL